MKAEILPHDSMPHVACTRCKVYGARVAVVDPVLNLALCRSCLAMLRTKLKHAFKVIEADEAEAKRQRGEQRP